MKKACKNYSKKFQKNTINIGTFAKKKEVTQELQFFQK